MSCRAGISRCNAKDNHCYTKLRQRRDRIFISIIEQVLRQKIFSHFIFTIFELFNIDIDENNTSCISVVANSTERKQTKHIDIKYHFGKNRVCKKIFFLVSILKAELLVGIFTKYPPKQKFTSFLKRLCSSL